MVPQEVCWYEGDGETNNGGGNGETGGGSTGGDVGGTGDAGDNGDGDQSIIDPVEQCEIEAVQRKATCVQTHTAGASFTALACVGLAPYGGVPALVCESAVVLNLTYHLSQCDVTYETNKALCD